MKAITLWQPWASLIALEVKTIETRSWPAPASLIGKRIAIHAAARKVPYPLPIAGLTGVYSVGRPGISVGMYLPDIGHVHLPLSAVVATAELRACVPMVDWLERLDAPYLRVGNDPKGRPLPLRLRPSNTGPSMLVEAQRPYGDFAPGRWAWILDDIETLDKPLPATGRQRLWDIYI